jgi:hypothetical protein
MLLGCFPDPSYPNPSVLRHIGTAKAGTSADACARLARAANYTATLFATRNGNEPGG